MGVANVPDNGLQRKDNGYYAGVTWQPMATPWTFTGAAYFNTSKNVIEEGDKGQALCVGRPGRIRIIQAHPALCHRGFQPRL